MRPQQEWNSFKNLLCIRPDNMGDVIMTGPAIRALKQAVRGRKITLLASTSGATIANFIPEIDEVIVFDMPWVKNDVHHSSEVVSKIIEEIKKHHFDAAVIFTVYSQNPLPSAMICYMAGIARIAGYCRENPYQLITDWIPDREPFYEIHHEVVRQMNLVKSLGAIGTSDELNLEIDSKAEKSILKDLCLKKLLPDTSYMVIHPGVSEERRQFDIDKLAEAARLLTDTFNSEILITGTEAEENLANYIVEHSGGKVKSLVGKLSMEELIVTIKNAQLLISNNTGPVHIAAAVNTSIVVLYAMTNPQHTPWKVKHSVLPFNVPENRRSKNIVIEYAYQNFYTYCPNVIEPIDIVNAVAKLLKSEDRELLTNVLMYEKD